MQITLIQFCKQAFKHNFFNLLLSLQIILLEENRSTLPEVTLPDGSTGNEVDTRRPTPPPYLPPGVNTSQKTVLEIEMLKNDVL